MEQCDLYDLWVKRGDTLEQDITFCEVIDNVRHPISLAGAAAKSEIRPNPGSPKLLASFDCDIYPEEGRVTIQLAAEDTLRMARGGYAWDLYLENAPEALSKYPIGGKFIVYDHVTEPSL